MSSNVSRRDCKSETRSEARNAQDAHRIFDECRADVAQDAGLQVGRAAERIDQLAIVVHVRWR